VDTERAQGAGVRDRPRAGRASIDAIVAELEADQ